MSVESGKHKLRKKIVMGMKIDLTKANEVRDRTLRNDPTMTLPPSLRINRNELSEIEPWLFVSGEAMASDPEILERTEIGYVINAAISVAKTGFPQKIEYLAFDMNDNTEQDLSSFIFHAIDFLSSIRQKKGRNKCLVHCQAGISRSVSLVLAYLMYINNMTFDNALSYVLSKRKVACPNISFECQLKNFETLLRTHHPSHVVYLKLRPHINSTIKPLYVAHTLNIGDENTITTNQSTLKMLADGDSPYYHLDTMFDSRGCYIIFTPNGKLYVWVGTLSNLQDKNACISYCHQLERILELSTHEIIPENEETAEFLNECKLHPPTKKVHLHKRCNNEYPTVRPERTIIRYPDWRLMNPNEIELETETPIFLVQPKINDSSSQHTPPSFPHGPRLQRPPVSFLRGVNVSSEALSPTTFKSPRMDQESQVFLDPMFNGDNPIPYQMKRRSNTALTSSSTIVNIHKKDNIKWSVFVYVPMHFPRFSTMEGKKIKENFELLSERADCVQTSGDSEIVQQFLDYFHLKKDEVEYALYFCNIPCGVWIKQYL
ncbi:Dual specificity protein phosphatase [Entamoeba marina]